MDVLKSFADKFNGKYIERKYDEFQKAEFEYEGFKVVFDYHVNYISGTSHRQKFTRIIVPFQTRNNFEFEIYPINFLSKIVSIIGFIKNIEIGRRDFDSKLMIKSNDGFKIKSFLNNISLRESLIKKNKFKFSISKDKGVWGEKLPINQFELSYFTEEIITDLNEFESIFELFQISVKQLILTNEIQPQAYIHKYNR